MNLTANPRAILSRRKTAGLTRTQLSVKAGVSMTTIHYAENFGVVSPATAAKLAAVFHCATKDLLP